MWVCTYASLLIQDFVYPWSYYSVRETSFSTYLIELRKLISFTDRHTRVFQPDGRQEPVFFVLRRHICIYMLAYMDCPSQLGRIKYHLKQRQSKNARCILHSVARLFCFRCMTLFFFPCWLVKKVKLIFRAHFSFNYFGFLILTNSREWNGHHVDSILTKISYLSERKKSGKLTFLTENGFEN